MSKNIGGYLFSHCDENDFWYKFIINILGIYVPNSFRKSSVHLSHDSNSIFKHCLKVGFCSVRLIFFCSRLTMMIILALLMSQGHVNITGSLVILVARQQLWLLVRIVFFFQGKTLFLAIHCGELNTSYFPWNIILNKVTAVYGSLLLFHLNNRHVTIHCHKDVVTNIILAEISSRTHGYVARQLAASK